MTGQQTPDDQTSGDAAAIRAILASNPDGISTFGLLGWGQLRIGSDFDEPRLRAALAALGPAVTLDAGFVKPTRGAATPQSTPAWSSQPQSPWLAGSRQANPSPPDGPRPAKTFWTPPAPTSPPPGRWLMRPGAPPRVRGRPFLVGVLIGIALMVLVTAPGGPEVSFGVGLLVVLVSFLVGSRWRAAAGANGSTAGDVLVGLSLGAAVVFVLIFLVPVSQS